MAQRKDRVKDEKNHHHRRADVSYIIGVGDISASPAGAFFDRVQVRTAKDFDELIWTAGKAYAQYEALRQGHPPITEFEATDSANNLLRHIVVDRLRRTA